MAAPKKIKNYGGETNKQAPSSNGNPKPASDVVEDFHTNSDLDTRPESQHHTLGPAPTQAAPGPHQHDGGDSALLLTGFTISGSRGGNVAMISIIAALVRLGATDSSTA